MPRKKKVMDSREVGLVMGLIMGRYFFHSDDLHYGFWPDDLAVTQDNILAAQRHHSELIINAIPEGVRTILDVGCGGGALAKRLMERGFHVEGVSPSGPLTEKARELVGPDCPIHATPYEQLQTDERYDLVLFSESYQYIKLAPSLQQTVRLLNPQGYMMICDFFRRPGMVRGPIRGGHRWEDFEAAIAAQPFVGQLDQDITKETARNYDLVNNFLQEVGVPIWELTFRYLHANYPRLTRLGKRVFRKRIEKMEHKYFTGQRTAAVFEEYKTYRLLRYQRSDQP